MVNNDAATFTFTSFFNEPVNNLKQWYNDPEMIGRHFLVFSVQDPTVKRHYTVCSTMNPVIKRELLNMADNFLNGRVQEFNANLLMNKDQNNISLTLKTYNTKRGLATRIHRTDIDIEQARKQVNFDDMST